jgi:hypothetical protein
MYIDVDGGGGWRGVQCGVLALYPKLTATPSFTVRFSMEAIDCTKATDFTIA